METIRKWIEENRITEVECLIPDITGNARGKIMPAKKIPSRRGHASSRSGFFPDCNWRLARR